MARNNKIYGDLSYANVQPTYVGAPITELDSLGQKLEQDYNVSLEARDKLQMAAANMRLLDKDNPILQKAIGDIDTQLKEYEQKGNWEAAQLSIRDAAKNFATNPLLKAAFEDKQQYDAWQKDLLENKNILDSDKSYAIQRTKLENTNQLEFDPETGKFKNRVNVYTAPEYVDANKEIQAVIKDMNPSTREKLLQAASTRGYLVSGDIKELTKDQLRKAAEDVVMSSEKTKSYLQFQAEKEDFNNRLTRTPDGRPALRDYEMADLRNYGLVDKDNNFVSQVKDKEGNRVFVDDKGKEINEGKDRVGVYKSQPVLLNEKGEAMTYLLPKTEKNNPILMYGKKDENGNVLIPGFYNEDGTLNKDVVGGQIKNRITERNINNFKEFAENFAYTQEDNKYIADWVSQENMRAANDRANIEFKQRLENQEAMDFYVNTFMTPSEDDKGNLVPKTIPQTAMKGLYPDGKADLSKSILAFAENSVGGLSKEEQKLIPYISNFLDNVDAFNFSQINKLKQDLKTKKITQSEYDAQYKKLNPTNKAVFNVSTNMFGEASMTDKELQSSISEFMQTSGKSEKELKSIMAKYSAMTDKEKSAVKTLGKIMQLPQAPVSLKNKDNVINEDGKAYIGVIATIDDSQLGLTDEEVDNLNEVFGKKIITTTNSKIVGEDGKTKGSKTREIQLWNEHTPSYEAQSAYNSNLGIKNSNANVGRFNEANRINNQTKGVKNLLNTYVFSSSFSEALNSPSIRNIEVTIDGKSLKISDIVSTLDTKLDELGKANSSEYPLIHEKARKQLATIYYQLKQQGIEVPPLQN
jgi:hypothetical protein